MQMAAAEEDSGRKRKLYFLPLVDIIVLKEVIAHNPFKIGVQVLVPVLKT